MMGQAFYTGLSGLKNSSTAIDVVSDNLSNSSTIGYRGYGVEFSNLFEGMINQTSSSSSVNSSIGVGVQVQATPMNEGTGELLRSDRGTDLAIDGDGWFGVQGNGGPIYTRAGNFNFDKNNDLITEDGFHLLGTMAKNIDNSVLTAITETIELGEVTTQEKLQFPDDLYFPSQPTTKASFFGNIGVVDSPRTMSASVIDPQNNKNELKLTFKKSLEQNQIDSKWDVEAVVQSLNGEIIYDVQNATVEFDTKGILVTNTLTSIDNNGSNVTIDLGSGFSGVIAADYSEVSSSSSSDGTPRGDLAGYSINQEAEVIAAFSNGMQSIVGKIALFHFQNDQGLNRISGSRFQETSNSGNAHFTKDENGKNILGANLLTHNLESSNYNDTVGLTELIIMQRSYDANSKTITTADQMIQKALNMGA